MEDLDIYMPTSAIRRHLFEAQTHFENFESIAMNLRSKGLMINDARFILDHVYEYYPSMSKYLSQKCDIGHEKLFEAAVVKIINNNGIGLPRAEKKSVESLKKDLVEYTAQNAEKIRRTLRRLFQKGVRRVTNQAMSIANLYQQHLASLNACSVQLDEY